MALTPWSWELPDPIIEDVTIIRASHMNDVRDAVNDTRNNTFTASDFVLHATSHGASGSDPLIESIKLSDYKYLSTGYSYLSSAPSNNTGYISNNLWCSGLSTFTAYNSLIKSSIISISPDYIKFGYSPIGSTSITYNLDINNDGDINTNGNIICNDITAADCSFTNVTVSGTLTTTTPISVPDPLTITTLNATNINNTTFSGGSLSTTGSITAGTLFNGKGLKLVSSQLQSFDNKTLQIQCLNSSTYKLMFMPQVMLDTLRNFEIRLGTTGYTLGNNLDILAGTVRIQTQNYGTSITSLNGGPPIGGLKTIIGNGQNGYSIPLATFNRNEQLFINGGQIVLSSTELLSGTSYKLGNYVQFGTADAAWQNSIGIVESAIDALCICGYYDYSTQFANRPTYTYNTRKIVLRDQVIIDNAESYMRDTHDFDYPAINKFWITDGPIAALSTDGYITLGSKWNSFNMAIDRNSIQVRHSINGKIELTSPSTLRLNPYGGTIELGINTALRLSLNGFQTFTNYSTAPNVSSYTPSSNVMYATSSGMVFSNRLCSLTTYTAPSTIHGGTKDVVIDESGYLITLPSSMRYKENIKSIKNDSEYLQQLDALLCLDVKEFNYKGNVGSKDLGLIAEEAAELGLDSLVVYDSYGSPETIRYSKLSLLNLELIKSLYERIEELERRFDE